MRHGSLHRVVPPPVGKTVGRDVDDAHHERPAQITTGMRQFEPSGAELPVGGGRRECHMSDGTGNCFGAHQIVLTPRYA
jgi:hypothetical protein